MPALTPVEDRPDAGASRAVGSPPPAPEPQHVFDDSRRLTGPSRWFAGTAVTLTARGPLAAHPAAHARWAAQVQAVAAALGWPAPQALAVVRGGHTTLSFAAPQGLLFTATEVNEWAWESACRQAVAAQTADAADADRATGTTAALAGFDLAHAWAVVDQDHDKRKDGGKGSGKGCAADDPARVHAHFSARAADELNPALQALLDAALAHDLPALVDDEALSLGTGCGSSSWPLDDLPAPAVVPWPLLHDVPTALVTGSNGKTTTVRLLAAIAAQAGLNVGHCSTEAVVIGGQAQQQGDYAGPAGARAVLRDRRVQLAVLETARGGLLRRGLALDRADVAVVTNLAPDHFGEYGIESLDDLAEVKLTVARALPPQDSSRGLLVLNADDVTLMAAAARLPHAAQARHGLFALDHDHPALVAQRARQGCTCGVDAHGQLRLHAGGLSSSLGAVRDWPLSLGGAALHNIANAAAAALAAWGLGLAVHHIAAALQAFGANPLDNPGRLERWAHGGATVLLDYAHNPEGLEQLLQVAQRLLKPDRLRALDDGTGTAAAPTTGRLGLLLGQAGNRDDKALVDLARTAAGFQPDHVVLKELPAMLRGRAPGSVSAALRHGLLAAGIAPGRCVLQPDEETAARELLAWARAGDVVVLPIHTAAVRDRLTAWLRHPQAGHRAG